MVELGQAGGAEDIPLAGSLLSPVASNCKLQLGKETPFLCTLFVIFPALFHIPFPFHSTFALPPAHPS